MASEKQAVSVYCFDVAKEIFLKEGKDIELNCISMEQRVCSSMEEIEKFYGVQPPLVHECPECGGSGLIGGDDLDEFPCHNCTNYAVNKTREKAEQKCLN